MEFQEKIWDYYHDYGRDLPWRHDPTPYQVVISEVMLQQTQVSRVIEKYHEWLAIFPSFEVLAEASVAEVVAAWQGLGYNRRALWLQRLAQMVLDEHAGELPRDPAELVKLPGIGPNTAGSIAAFAYNEPTVFIETNIRRVYIDEFFPESIAPTVIPTEVEGSLGNVKNPQTLRQAQGDNHSVILESKAEHFDIGNRSHSKVRS